MNKVKIFGKVQYVSDLKFDITGKLKVYMNIEIVSEKGNIFKSVIYDELCDKYINVNIGEYVYALGYAILYNSNNMVFVLEELYIV